MIPDQPSYLLGLNDGMTISASPLDIYAVVSATENFESFRLQYGVGNNPSKWHTLYKSDNQEKEPEKLVTWDVYEADAARVTLRIVMTSTKDTTAEKRIHLNLDVPTLTPSPEPTMTNTTRTNLDDRTYRNFNNYYFQLIQVSLLIPRFQLTLNYRTLLIQDHNF